ncbi:DUF4276 family protein [Kovacikia minuta CCNUW1]|uniref:DUF4276 family protein n=1 Tax=Kovacikia minuta TaxID=2931930 RepID=UPI001CCBA6E4|nr:DUF4276 family protein [Kovacikia minuta]UBF24172.1 DUF4276 family protein [Kovacikia minuta CCNUW1]
MHIEFLVEDLSTQEACTLLLPTLLPSGTEYEIRSFRGKQDLLSKLPDRLRAYRGWLPQDWRIVVLVDCDNENCQDLKSKLEERSRQAGFITKTACSQGREFQVLNRIMIEELEAWFFGDVEAICQAYTGISSSLAQKVRYRDPDAIQGGTWEALPRELQRAGLI